MENISKLTERISRREVAYYRRRHQNRLFAELASFFANEAEAGRTTRKDIAVRLDKDPAQITRWLSSPTNLEADTISDLLLAMGAEMDHRIVRFVDRPKQNFAHPVYLGTNATMTTAPVSLRVEQSQQVPNLRVEVEKQAQTTQPVIITKVSVDAAV